MTIQHETVYQCFTKFFNEEKRRLPHSAVDAQTQVLICLTFSFTKLWVWLIHKTLSSGDFISHCIPMTLCSNPCWCLFQNAISSVRSNSLSYFDIPLAAKLKCDFFYFLMFFLQDRKVLTFTLWHVLVKILWKSEGDSFVPTKFPGGCVGCWAVTAINVLQRTFVRCWPWNISQYFHCVTSVILS